MNQYQRRIIYINQRLLQRPPLWQRWLLALGTIAVLVVSFMLGAVLLTVAVGVAAITALIVGTRVWWLRRKLRNDSGGDQDAASGDLLRDMLAAAQRQQQRRSNDSAHTIDGESEDISDRH